MLKKFRLTLVRKEFIFWPQVFTLKTWNFFAASKHLYKFESSPTRSACDVITFEMTDDLSMQVRSYDR